VRLVHPVPTADVKPLRFAVTEMYAAQSSGRAFTVNMNNKQAGNYWRRYGVHVGLVDRKLCCAWPNGYGEGKMYFMTFNNISDR
jgi:hypothetical protein